MKYTFLTFVTLLALSASLQAQAPQAFNYQGVARDLSGTALATKNISVKASILNGSITGTVVYAETHAISTNQFGLFTLAIGTGTATNGTFANTNWASGNKYLKIEIDPNGGSSYTLSGTTQLLSVPYAMYATSAGDNKWSDVTGGINYSEGKVGIGTASPAAWLHASKNVTGLERMFLQLENVSNGEDASASVSISAGTGNNKSSLFLGVYGSTYFPTGIPDNTGIGFINSKKMVISTGGDSQGYIAFRTGYNQNSTPSDIESARIDALGNFGIGTKTPSSKLHVNGTVRLQGLSSSSTLTNALVTDANGNVFTKDISTLGASQWTNNSVGINYNGGRVGIGTSAPISPLNIVGNLTGTDRNAIEIKNTNTGQDGICGIGLSVNDPTQDRAGLQVFSSNYFPDGLPFSTGRTILSSLSKNGIKIEAYATNANLEFAVGPSYVEGSLAAQTPIRMIIKNDGNIGIGTTTPSATLHTNGTVRLQGLTSNSTLTNALVTDANGNVYTKDISTLEGSSQWTNNSVGISYNGGKVGIGTSSPQSPMEIYGNFEGNDRTQLSITNTNTSQGSAAAIAVNAGSTSGAIQVFSEYYFPTTLPFNTARLNIASTSKYGIKLDAESNATSNIEFAVGPKTAITSDIAQTPVRMIVTYSGNVGVGTTTPTQKLDVNGKVRVQQLDLNTIATKVVVADADGVLGYKDVTSLDSWVKRSDGSAIEYTSIYGTKNTTNGHLFTLDAKGNASYGSTLTMRGGNTGSDDFWGLSANKNLNVLEITKFNTNGQFSYMTFNDQGNIGVGTTSPKAKLQITSGDVYLDDATKGIIMKNTSGQCYRITVGTAGALVSTLITCP